MPLTMRPTGLSRDPNDPDWCVYDGGAQPIGRIYEDKTAPTEGARWAWYLQVTDAYRSGVKDDRPRCWRLRRAAARSRLFIKTVGNWTG